MKVHLEWKTFCNEKIHQRRWRNVTEKLSSKRNLKRKAHPRNVYVKIRTPRHAKKARQSFLRPGFRDIQRYSSLNVSFVSVSYLSPPGAAGLTRPCKFGGCQIPGPLLCDCFSVHLSWPKTSKPAIVQYLAGRNLVYFDRWQMSKHKRKSGEHPQVMKESAESASWHRPRTVLLASSQCTQKKPQAHR